MCTFVRPLFLVGCLLASTSAFGQPPQSDRGAGGTSSKVWTGIYSEYCAVCHGADLTGEAQGTPLVGTDLMHGDSLEELIDSIGKGVPGTGMEEFATELSANQIRMLAIYISEERAGMTFRDWRIRTPLDVPTGTQSTELHNYRIDTVVEGLDPLPYSIAPLPDGRILLTEKTRGLTVISKGGEQSELLAGAPKGYADSPESRRQRLSNGWILDVAPHPEFKDNGWIYLSFTERCTECTGAPKSGLKLIRGRISGGRWVDEETVWEIDRSFYTPGTDMAAGGRITFDQAGHLFLAFGMRGIGYAGIQDLDHPWGKIHRMRDDGQVPKDNPFLDVEGALPTIWTLGHRSPHGLEFDPLSGRLFETEMGPRGGDEVNHLVAGRNYGWPLTSGGVHYNGKPVDGEGLGIEFDLAELAEPMVDFTPGVAISSFVVYNGETFPKWRGNLLVGSLKGSDLERFVIENGVVTHRETVVEDLARIRDVEIAPNGDVLLLLEPPTGAQIVRLSPVAQ